LKLERFPDSRSKILSSNRSGLSFPAGTYIPARKHFSLRFNEKCSKRELCQMHGKQMLTRPISQTGFTLVELLVVIAILGILAATAVSNYTVWSAKANDTIAQSDYRNIKTALVDTLSDPATPDRFLFRNQIGPGELPYPMDSASISADSVVSLSHRTRVRNNRRPTTQTTLTVQHREGNKIYQYAEANGTIVEQVIDRR
jgi:type IV pilus assembly protein PilA